MNILKVYDKLKVITKVKKIERYLKHAKPCNRCGSRERERVAFYTNRQEENKINKVRVGADSTLKSIYIKEGKHNARKLAYVFLLLRVKKTLLIY